MPVALSEREARRIALRAQGLAGARGRTLAGKKEMLRAIDRLGVLQIDSVNVVSRAHYMPLFSRLGAYPRAELDALALGKRRRLFEYWGHEASLMPVETQPLLRWRMEDARDGRGVWRGVAAFLREQPALVARALDEISDRGPLSASELELATERSQASWWGWSEAKRAFECLFWTGRVTAAGRRATFERVYDLPERVLPARIASSATPDRAEAQRALLRIAADAMGVATAGDLRDYFRFGATDTKLRLAEMVENKELIEAKVSGWNEPAFLAPAARKPRAVERAALLSPFDNLIWFRRRTERLFGVKVRLEIYTPAHKRTHGYYVFPFLQGDRITARVDLKADRKAGLLLVQAAHREPDADGDTLALLAGELALMAEWLGLGGIRVNGGGDLSAPLAAAIR